MLIFSLLFLILLSSLSDISKISCRLHHRLTLIVITFIIILVGTLLIPNSYYAFNIYNNLFKINLFNQLMILLILIISWLIIAMYTSIITFINIFDSITTPVKEFTILLLFNIFGLILLTQINDLISLFITIELQSYSFYLITASSVNSYQSTKAGLTYFLIGGLASIIILFGSALLYYSFGLTNLDYIFSLYFFNNYFFNLNFGFIFIIIGLLVKIGSAPFYNWLINIYANVPTYITVWISIMGKLSILTLIFNFILYTNDNTLAIFISFIACLSMLIGSIAGLLQIKIKVIFALSGLLNIGYLLLLVQTNHIKSLSAFLYFIYQYALTHVSLFLLIFLCSYIVINTNYYKSLKINYDKTLNTNYDNTLNTNNYSNTLNKSYISNYSPLEYVDQLHCLLNKNSYLAFAFIICLFSLIGIPPLIGFYGKFNILIATLTTGSSFMSIILIICSLISTVYYSYIIRSICFDINVNNTIFNNFIMQPGATQDLGKYNNVDTNKLSPTLTYILAVLILIILFNGYLFYPLVQEALIDALTLFI